MDDKMIVTTINVLGADLVWTSMWIAVALVLYYSSSTSLRNERESRATSDRSNKIVPQR
jgi:hypothetical protein